MEYKNLSLDEAAKDVIWTKVDKTPNSSGGGVICVDKNGNISMEFNTGMMHRAWAKSNGEWGVGVLKNGEKKYKD